MSTWPAKLNLRYTMKDMDRLERQGKAKRQNLAGVPDVASLSQLLRTIGAYVEEKRGRLVKISRHGDSLAIQYDTVRGKRREETVSVASLYEFWVKLYLQRSGADEK
jgi:UDP-N-acetylglucosamine enolpyruvyl transferase